MIKRSLLLLIPFFVIGVPCVDASPCVWKNVVLGGGGAVLGISADPHEEGLFYMRTDVGGAYRWEAGSSSWIGITEKLPGGHHNDFGIDSLVVDPSVGKTLYLLTGKYPSAAHLYKSVDAGQSWTSLTPPPDLKSRANGSGKKFGERFGVDPNAPNVLAIASRNIGFWMSSDGGSSWKQQGRFAPDGEQIASKTYTGMSFVAFDKGSGQNGKPTPVIYVGVDDPGKAGGVWKSIDGGETWQAMRGGLTTPARGAVAADGTLYVTYHGAKELDLKGAVCKAPRSALVLSDCTPAVGENDDEGFVGLAVDPAESKNVCVAQYGGRFNLRTFWSTDGGASWTKVSDKHGLGNEPTRDETQWFGSIAQVAINPFNSKEVWMADWLGILRTTDISNPTQKWDYLYQGHEEIVPLALVCPPSGARLVSGHADTNGAVHHDPQIVPARSFCHASNPVSYGSTTGLDFCEADPKCWARVLGSFVGGPNGYYSTDGGESWSAFPSIPPSARHGHVAVSAKDPKVIVWQSEDGKLYYTDNRGVTWKQSASAPSVKLGEFQQDAQPLASDRVNGDTFYLLCNLAKQGKTEIWRSEDRGASWAVVSVINHPKHATLYQYKLIATPGIEGKLWLNLGHDRTYKTIDGGYTFEEVPGVESAGLIAFGKSAPGQKVPAVFVVGGVNHTKGIFRSDDDGAHWSRIDNPDTPINDFPRVIAADMQVFGRVYIGTDGRGIYYNEVPIQP